MEKIYNGNLTKEELEKIEQAINEVGEYGSVEIKKTSGIIDIIQSKRIRIKSKKVYNKG